MSKTLRATWQSGNEFAMKIPEGERWTLTSIPGDERPGPGPSPMEALLGAVAGCSGIDIVMILKKMRKPLEGLRIEVEGERRDEHPRIFTRIDLTYHLDGSEIDAHSAARAVELSLTKYCSVSAMLHGNVDLVPAIVLNGEPLP